jgi:hypothetical protein
MCSMQNSIISGAYDLHTHSAPDVLPRRFDDIDMAQRVIESGMAGYAIKSHFFCTAERAKLINKLYPKCHAVGMVWLNNSVGGINPFAVELAGRAGNKLVGFPTVDTEASITRTFTLPPEKRGFWASIIVDMKNDGIELRPVVVSRDGKLVPEVYDVLDIIAKYNMILATGHISLQDCLLLTKAAQERKVERIICTHVSSVTSGYAVEYQKQMLQYGAYMEHCTNAWSSGKVPYETMVEQIRAIGLDRIVICTDLGQPKNKYPDEGLYDFCTKLVEESGFSESDVRKAIVDNPVALLK